VLQESYMNEIEPALFRIRMRQKI